MTANNIPVHSKYVRHRGFAGLDRGKLGVGTAESYLKAYEAFLEPLVTKLAATGTGQTFVGVPNFMTATSVLTLTGNAGNNETVIINGRTYTFQSTLVDAPDNVLIGAAATNSIDNLIAAINAGAGAGTLYGTGTAVNPVVSAVAGAGDTMDVSSKLPGADGNAITTTETLANGAWTGATLAGGITGNTLTVTGHGFTTAAGPFTVSNAGGALPVPMSAGTFYFFGVAGVNTLTIHTTWMDAVLGTNPFDISTAGTGTNTLTPGVDKFALAEVLRKGVRTETLFNATDIDSLMGVQTI